MASREEWKEQEKLAGWLEKYLDPACTLWSATDPVAPSARIGMWRKKRGVRAGIPDLFVIQRAGPGVIIVFIEMKSRVGTASRSQRATRRVILAVGALWWMCKSAAAAMWALAQSGVQFRAVGGKPWAQPPLAAWEVPKRNPREKRPRAPLLPEARRAKLRTARLHRERERGNGRRSELAAPGRTVAR